MIAERSDQTITPNFLPSPKTLDEYRRRLHEKPQWHSLMSKDPEKRSINIQLRYLPSVILAIHKILGDKVDLPKIPKKGKSAKKSLESTRIQAIEIAKLFIDGKTDDDGVSKSFPTEPNKWSKPYSTSLGEANNVYEAWKMFCENPDVNSIDEDENNLGKDLFESLRELEAKHPSQKYFGVRNIFVTPDFSDNVRMQLGSLFNEISIPKSKNPNPNTIFTNTVIGNLNLTYTTKFQALVRAYLADYFTQFKNSTLPNKQKPYFNSRDSVPTPIPQNRRSQFQYLLIDPDTSEMATAEVKIDYTNDQGAMFIETLGFYIEAINAFREEIKHYLETSELDIQESFFVDSLLLDLSNLPPARPKPEYPIYIFGESYAEENCPTCGRQMKQFCDRVTDLGGQKISFWVQTYCPGHHHDARRLTSVPRSLLKY